MRHLSLLLTLAACAPETPEGEAPTDGPDTGWWALAPQVAGVAPPTCQDGRWAIAGTVKGTPARGEVLVWWTREDPTLPGDERWDERHPLEALDLEATVAGDPVGTELVIVALPQSVSATRTLMPCEADAELTWALALFDHQDQLIDCGAWGADADALIAQGLPSNPLSPRPTAGFDASTCRPLSPVGP